MEETSVIRRILMMVHELHKMGYQQIRIAPGMSPSGAYWRCSIAPASSFKKAHGARMADGRLSAGYSSSAGGECFGWRDAPGMGIEALAAAFIERFPGITGAGFGPDWAYAGWYMEMLRQTAPDAFPIAFADWDLPGDCLATIGGRQDVRLPLPPSGGGVQRNYSSDCM